MSFKSKYDSFASVVEIITNTAYHYLCRVVGWLVAIQLLLIDGCFYVLWWCYYFSYCKLFVLEIASGIDKTKGTCDSHFHVSQGLSKEGLDLKSVGSELRTRNKGLKLFSLKKEEFPIHQSSSELEQSGSYTFLNVFCCFFKEEAGWQPNGML